MATALVIGTGASGARAVRQLAADSMFDEIGIVDPDADRVRRLVASGDGEIVDRGRSYSGLSGIDVVVLCSPAGRHRLQAEAAIDAGSSVVSMGDSVDDVAGLLDLDAAASDAGLSVIVGAGFAPGLTCLLSRHAAALFDRIEEIHVAKHGTGGPACARQHHRALAGQAIAYRDGAWIERRGQSGRELCWFPDPIGAVDCYRAALPEVRLLVPAFPGVSRVTARMSATRRDRVTARLPMLRPPHSDGGPGGIRVEVRGQRDGGKDVLLLGAMDHPSQAAAVVAATSASFLASGQISQTGAFGLASLDDAVPMLRDLERHGVACAVFEGT